MQSFIMNSHEGFIPIHQGCFAGTGAIVRLPQCQWSKPDGYGKISQCITTTKHSKAKTVCIFLGIYCTCLADMLIDQFHNASVPYPAMITEICTCGVWDWCIVESVRWIYSSKLCAKNCYSERVQFFQHNWNELTFREDMFCFNRAPAFYVSHTSWINVDK